MQMSDSSYVFKIVWCKDSEDGYMGKVVGIEDSEVGADCWEALHNALIEHIYRHIDYLRKTTGLPYKKEKIQVKVEEISEEEFGPLFADEEWDEDCDED